MRLLQLASLQALLALSSLLLPVYAQENICGKIIIKNPNNIDLTDYQVRIELPNLMYSHFKVLDENSNELNYCFEQPNGECSKNENSHVIWVKIPHIPAEGQVNLIIAKSSTNDAKNGNQVFDFYDDFNNPGDLEGWRELNSNIRMWYITSSGTVKEDGGWHNNWRSPIYPLIYTKRTFDKAVIEAKGRYFSGDDDLGVVVYANSNSKGYSLWHGWGAYPNSDVTIGIYCLTCGWSWVQRTGSSFKYDLNPGEWGIFKVHIDSGKIEGSVNGKCCAKANISPYGYHIGLFGWVQPTEFDWIRVRKYAPREVEVIVPPYLSCESAGIRTSQGILCIENPNDENLPVDYQVRVDLQKLYAQIKAFKYPVITYNGNPVNYCFEQPNGECDTNPGRYIWIKLPDQVPAHGMLNMTLKLSDSPPSSLVNGDQVFDFYDDFNSNSIEDKWIVRRTHSDHTCILKDGILWLVTKSKRRGCNIEAQNLTIPNKAVIDVSFKIDYVCGNANDGDGISITIGEVYGANTGCHKGIASVKGPVIAIYNDHASGSNLNGLSINQNSPGNCGKPSHYSVPIPNKTQDLSYGLISIKRNGNNITVNYSSLKSDFKISLSRENLQFSGNHLIIGAGTGCSRCGGRGCSYSDSAHGIDMVRVRKYAPQEPRSCIKIKVCYPSVP